MIEDTEKLYRLIQECEIRRLTTKESLDYIKQNGIKLSERTFRRYKKELKDNIQQKVLEEYAQSDSEFLQRLETRKAIEHEYWKIYSNTNNESMKLKLLHSIQDIQEPLYDYYKKIRWRAERIEDDIKEQEEERERAENQRFEESQEAMSVKKSKKDVVCN